MGLKGYGEGLDCGNLDWLDPPKEYTGLERVEELGLLSDGGNLDWPVCSEDPPKECVLVTGSLEGLLCSTLDGRNLGWSEYSENPLEECMGFVRRVEELRCAEVPCSEEDEGNLGNLVLLDWLVV